MKAIGIKMVELQPMTAEERNDMSCQLTSMRNYSDILLSRLTRAGVDFK